jgi:hypothetical protein
MKRYPFLQIVSRLYSSLYQSNVEEFMNSVSLAIDP